MKRTLGVTVFGWLAHLYLPILLAAQGPDSVAVCLERYQRDAIHQRRCTMMLPRVDSVGRVDTVTVRDTVTLTRVDTLRIAADTVRLTDTLRTVRVDTVTIVRVDTVRIPAPTPTPTPTPVPPVDTVTPPPPPPPDTVTPPPPPPPPPPSASRPNEPAGFTRVIEFKGDAVPPWPPVSWGEAGTWWSSPYPSNRLAAVLDASAPNGRALELTYPAGLNNGTSPALLGGWLGTTRYKRMYLSLWIHLASNDGVWENHPVGTKIGGFIAYGQPTGAKNEGILWITGCGGLSSCLRSEFAIEFRQQNHVTRNIRTTGRMKVGRWEHWELVMELNDLGVANGRLRWWQNGTLIVDQRDVVYVKGTNTLGLGYYKLDPTWGGNTCISRDAAGTCIASLRKGRSDRLRVANLYASGQP